MYIEKSVKINIIGDPLVGKSSFVYALFNHTFEPNQKIESIDPEKSITFIHGNYNFQLSFLETCGSNTSCYETIKNCNAVILFFSLIDRNTFDNVDIFIDAYNSSYPNNEIPIVLAGTKKDGLNQNSPNIDEIEMLKIPYHEVCASDIESIHNLLKSLLDPIVKKDKLVNSNEEIKQQKKKDKKEAKEKRGSKDKKEFKEFIHSNKIQTIEEQPNEQIQDQQFINDDGATLNNYSNTNNNSSNNNNNNTNNNNNSDINNNIIEFNESEIKEINLTNDENNSLEYDKKDKKQKKGFFSLFRLKRKSNSTNQISQNHTIQNNNSLNNSNNNLINNNNSSNSTSNLFNHKIRSSSTSTPISSSSSPSPVPISPRNHTNSNSNHPKQPQLNEDKYGVHQMEYNKMDIKDFSQQCGSLKKLNDKKDINNIKSFEYEIENI